MRSDLAKKVLPPSQQKLKPLLEEFSSTHILVWWTAIALQIGHRQSIDFDLFRFWPQGSGKELMQRIQKSWFTPNTSDNTIRWLSHEEQSEAHCVIHGVKIQFVDFSRNPFDEKISLESNKILEWSIASLDLLHLWAMKIYAMMYRAKWKDAIDLVYIMKQWFSLEILIEKAKEIFKKLYQEKASLETLIDEKRDMSEEVIWIDENHMKKQEILDYLKKMVDKYLKTIRNHSSST